jgi:hypothetical protein
MVSKFGRLIIWENDAENKGRILAKIRCSELRDNPKSVRFTEGEQPEAESWTFSVEVLSQTLLGAGPQDEDPIPDDGSDPHLCLYNIFNLLLYKILLSMHGRIKMWSLLCNKKILLKTRTML